MATTNKATTKRAIPVLEASAETAAKYTIIGGAFRSEKAAIARARKSIIAESAVVIHFAASALMGTPEGWWFAIAKDGAIAPVMGALAVVEMVNKIGGK